MNSQTELTLPVLSSFWNGNVPATCFCFVEGLPTHCNKEDGPYKVRSKRQGTPRGGRAACFRDEQAALFSGIAKLEVKLQRASPESKGIDPGGGSAGRKDWSSPFKP
jgi:hypothetical protein